MSMHIKPWPDWEIRVEKKRVGHVPVLILRPQDAVSQEAIRNFERHFEQALRMKP